MHKYYSSLENNYVLYKTLTVELCIDTHQSWWQMQDLRISAHHSLPSADFNNRTRIGAPGPYLQQHDVHTSPCQVLPRVSSMSTASDCTCWGAGGGQPLWTPAVLHRTQTSAPSIFIQLHILLSCAVCSHYLGR